MGSEEKECFILGAVMHLFLTGNHLSVSWVVQGTGGGSVCGESSRASLEGEGCGSCSQYAVASMQLAGYSRRRVELAYVGGLCLKVSTV